MCVPLSVSVCASVCMSVLCMSVCVSVCKSVCKSVRVSGSRSMSNARYERFLIAICFKSFFSHSLKELRIVSKNKPGTHTVRYLIEAKTGPCTISLTSSGQI